jgi:[acyl-carrier-protein] S-malonyltransferase
LLPRWNWCVAKRRALVVAPGRGTYNRGELGYLARWHGTREGLIAGFDAQRVALNQPTISALDRAEQFDPALHLPGSNAAALIYACSYADWLAIDREAFDIVAVTGNSMGWYSALACAGVRSAVNGHALVNHMGTLMQREGAGAQVVHTTVDANWRPISGRREALLAIEPTLHVSIELGGMIVLAGPQDAVDRFIAAAPREGSFPLPLPGHAAFHTPLMAPIVERARGALSVADFAPPALPLIDGRGGIWRPQMSQVEALWDYTLGAQLTQTYDFTRAISVGVREFAPDCVIVLGPGETLGGAVIQSLIAARWQGLDSRNAFMGAQAERPLVLAMGRGEQRMLVTD